MSRFESESELAALLVDWLRSERYEVAQEVDTRGFGCIDVVARMGRKLWVIETKLSLSLDLAAQAFRRRGLAHRVSVAVPYPKRYAARARVGERAELLRGLGIGTMTVDLGGQVRKLADGVFQRPSRLDILEAALEAEHFSGEYADAGSAGGGQFTQFARTSRAVTRFVAENPGSSIAEIIEGVEHHYASTKSARACIDDMIRKGVIKGKGSGRMRRYFPDDTEAA